MKITKQILNKIYQNKYNYNDEFLGLLNDGLDRYEINTPLRIASFLAQTGAETSGMTVKEENLNYSFEGLLANFPKYFNIHNAQSYARRPILIASRIYANRMQNGDELSGDGWDYRGRGYIQLTGKENYTRLFMKLGEYFPIGNVIENPELLLIEVNAIESSLFFWKDNNLNYYADKKQIDTISKKINGGTNAIKKRRELFVRALPILQNI